MNHDDWQRTIERNWPGANFTQPTTEADTDPMSPDQMLDTLRGLVREVHSAKSGRTVAVQSVAAVHVFHILDTMVSAGHELPEAWKR